MNRAARTATAFSSPVAVRSSAPRERQPLIFAAFRSLGVGQAMQLVNDHDPKPLYYQFQAEMPGEFRWDYLESGPDTWRVSISKLAPSHADSPS